MSLDVIFLSYDEPNADANFERLVAKVRRAKRLHGVEGVARANKLTAEISASEWYYLIDADAWVLESFKPLEYVEKDRSPGITVHMSLNPANGLVYGFGGIKLCHIDAVRSLKDGGKDLFTTGDYPVVFSKTIASETHFNSDPYRAWRGAFRETIALRGMYLLGMSPGGIQRRVDEWRSVDPLAAFSSWIIRGCDDAEAIIEEIGSEVAQRRIHEAGWCQTIFEERRERP